MKNALRYSLITLLTLSHSAQAQPLPLQGKSFFSPRSQSTNAARDLVGEKEFLNHCCAHNGYGAFAATLEYNRSYKTHRIAQYFFGYDTIRFTGSQVTDRLSNDILADYFGLGTTFDSIVHLIPKVQNVIADFSLYCGLDNVAENLYFKISAPIVSTRWKMKLEEEITDNGTELPYPALYMAQDAIPAPLKSAESAFARTTPFGDVKEGLNFGRIDGHAHRKEGIADIHATLGWNFICREHGHAGFNLHLGIPTGNRSKAIYLFEPIFGNGHHVELGAGFSGHVLIWEKDGLQTLAFYADLNVNHLFESSQRRSFDFKIFDKQLPLLNPDMPDDIGFGSRYTLLKEFDSAGAYTGTTVPAINRTTLRCKTYYAIEFDLALMFGYQHCGLSVDFGYNGWFRSRERISLQEGIAKNTFGLKGIQNVALMAGGRSNATQSTATLHGNNFADQALVANANPPIFVNTNNINVESGAMSRCLSHKFFAHVSYAWSECPSGIIPYFGFGSELEFEGIRPHWVEINKPTMSIFGVWIKGGFGF